MTASFRQHQCSQSLARVLAVNFAVVYNRKVFVLKTGSYCRILKLGNKSWKQRSTIILWLFSSRKKTSSCLKPWASEVGWLNCLTAVCNTRSIPMTSRGMIRTQKLPTRKKMPADQQREHMRVRTVLWRKSPSMWKCSNRKIHPHKRSHHLPRQARRPKRVPYPRPQVPNPRLPSSTFFRNS